MKKYLASAGLILATVGYTLFQHQGSDDDTANIIVGKPTGIPESATSSTKTGQPFGAAIPVSNSAQSTKTPVTTPKPVVVTGKYRDGSYTGNAADAYYGLVQVKAIISGGKLTDVQVLQYPNDRETSQYINDQALPYLKQEAIAMQSAHVNTISGASDTSAAFQESLGVALAKAKP